jgi:hypothetical protein
MTFGEVAESYVSLDDAAMTVSRSEWYFFLLLPPGTREEPAGDGIEVDVAASSAMTHN